MNLLSRLRRWQLVALVILLVVAIVGGFIVFRSMGKSDLLVLEGDQQMVTVRRGELVNKITVSGSVVFPERENMTFGSDGVVADVLVKEGQRVSEGESIATLDAEAVARLEREVTDARAGVRDAQEALDDLINPPSLAVAEAEHKVAVARSTLDDATETLDRIVNPTGLQIGQAEANVATATLELEQAEEALADGTGPTPEFKLAQARMQVGEAEIALADLERVPTKLELAQTEARVADAEVALQDAIEARDDYMSGPSPEELQDAGDAVGNAQKELSNSVSDLAVVEREWAAKDVEVRDALNSAADAYSETFKTWLGLHADPASMDSEYEKVFEDLGIDLNALFSEPNRFSGLSYSAPTLPQNDPLTAWDETQVYVWLHFSTYDLVPTCDRGEHPPFGVCIEEEFRVASDAYQQAIDDRVETDSQSSNAIAAAQARVDIAETGLRTTSDSLSDLEDLPDPLVTEQLEASMRVAAEALTDAKMDLADLAQPTDLLINERNLRLEVARATLDDAREELEELATPMKLSEIEHLEAQVEVAKANLEEAKAELEELTSGVTHPEYAVAQRAANVARETLADESKRLTELTGEPDSIELALLQSRLEAAKTLLSESELRLDDATLEAPWEGFVSRVEAESGKEIKATEVVAVLVDTSVVEIDGTVDEIDVLKIQLDAAAEVKMDALPDEAIEGTVSFVGAEANSDQGVVNYPVRVQIDLPPDLKAPEGLSAIATIILSRESDVLLIPANAIRGSFDNPVVHLMGGDESIETPVTLGNSDDFWTVVTDGLDEGDVVVAVAPEGQEVEFFTDGEDDGNGNDGP